MMQAAASKTPFRLDLVLLPAIVVVAFCAAIVEVARSPDPRMVVQAWTFAACMAGIAIFYLRTYGGGLPADERSGYSDAVIRAGVIASMFWAIAGMLVGVIIALDLAYPRILYATGLPFLNFGRLRPLHTSGAIFGFGGNVLIATSFYVVQRTSKARLFGGSLPWFVFWGFNTFIVLAGTGYLEGITQAREYAEPEWYADIWLTIVWVGYLLTFLGTIWKRREPHIYVANWFYLAFIVTIAMLHIINNLAIPVTLYSTKSISLFSGVQDALTQWWYGHNAVGFFLTAGFLGIMYYFVPKRAGRPIYSYRLSVVHFWALIFIYIWAGPHHLLYTALPEWAQTLGMTMSIILWMPSWGGMINGLMTLSGAWDKLRTDPVLRMLILSVAFYGMSTFEGPLMSIKTVNALSHYTNWTIGHVHSGTLGWVGYVSFGALYCMVPWLWKKQRLYSTALVEWHFWISTLGIVLYITSMWVAGITQGLMWRAYNEFGFLEYSFAESVQAMHPFYIIRAIGGGMYLLGVLIMTYNLWRTTGGSVPAIGDLAEPVLVGEGA
ncbi:MAG: cytochrome-c oxidase, cbb3-type subunit I [Rhizomicrobium sp.]